MIIKDNEKGLPLHVDPSPVKPSLHSHMYDPLPSVQVALSEQLSPLAPTAPQFISSKKDKSKNEDKTRKISSISILCHVK